ncbi:hypothetical protein D1007_33402 [Hordeum vulgare]|nr:hypothetical protein D1007_33402 [Hordeum vulgare]
MARRTEMQCEIDGLKVALALAGGRQEAALRAQAMATSELASLQGKVSGAASLVERATDEAREAWRLQLLRSKMFQDLEWRACRALGFIYRGSIPRPLIPDDTDYLDFFTKVVERLEAGAQQVGALIKEESRDLLSQALMHIFSNIFCNGPRS